MKKSVLSSILSLMMLTALFAQNRTDYSALMKEGRYPEALVTIESLIQQFYLSRLDDTRIPTGFISMNTIEREPDLMELFRNRKVNSFYIEHNDTIHALHLSAAECNRELKKPDHALSHYFQALRFRDTLAPEHHSIIFAIAQIFKVKGLEKGYLTYLEQASNLQPGNTAYALELGLALSKTRDTERALHFLRRSINASNYGKDQTLLIAAGLYETSGNFLEADKMYRLYLEKNTTDAAILFAHGYLMLNHTGNHSESAQAFRKALGILPEKDIYRRSKSQEFLADIAMKDLDFSQAIERYREVLNYQTQLKMKLEARKKDRSQLVEQVNSMKKKILTDPTFSNYEEYEELLDKKGKLENVIVGIEHEFDKLNPGKVRWNMAESLARLEKDEEAIRYYDEAVSYDYQTALAREQIIKLRLKIKRGY